MHPTTAVPATERVYRHLKRNILEQVHSGGTLLTEAEIAEAVGVSRTPVREALLRLEAEGLLRLYPKRGALVLPVSAQEVNDVIEARKLIEGHAAAAVWPRRAALIPVLEPLLALMREAPDITTFMEADRAFHAAVVEAAGNAILTDFYQRLRDRQMRMGVATLRLSPERRPAALAEHEELVAALREDLPAHWQALVRHHVETAAHHLRGFPS